jgi:hypothetical protein
MKSAINCARGAGYISSFEYHNSVAKLARKTNTEVSLSLVLAEPSSRPLRKFLMLSPSANNNNMAVY